MAWVLPPLQLPVLTPALARSARCRMMAIFERSPRADSAQLRRPATGQWRMELTLRRLSASTTRRGASNISGNRLGQTRCCMDEMAVKGHDGLIRGCNSAIVIRTRKAAIVVDDHCPIAEPKSVPDHAVIVALSASAITEPIGPFIAIGQERNIDTSLPSGGHQNGHPDR